MQNDKDFVLILFFDLNHCGYSFKTTSVCIYFMLKETVSEQLTAKQLTVWLVMVAFAFMPGFPIDFKAEGKMTFSLIFFVAGDVAFQLVVLASKLKQKIFLWLD